MILVKLQQPVLLHLPQLQGQSAALHPQIVRQLLPGKGDVQFIGPQPLGLRREIGHDLGPGGALAHVGELFPQTQVFPRQLPQKITDDPAVVGAGGGAQSQNAPHVQKQDGDRRFRQNAHVQHRARRAGIGGGKDLSRPRLGQNIPVPPDILLEHQDRSRQHQTHRLCRIPRPQHKGVLGVVFRLGPETGEHGLQLSLRNAGKQPGSADHRQKILHSILFR